MTETEQATQIANLQASAYIMFNTLNGVYQLHTVVALEPEDGDKAIDACEHCSEIAEAIVHYPCPTVQILLQDMVVDEVAPEEETAEPEETSQQSPA
jgi:hypothetical protein